MLIDLLRTAVEQTSAVSVVWRKNFECFQLRVGWLGWLVVSLLFSEDILLRRFDGVVVVAKFEKKTLSIEL